MIHRAIVVIPRSYRAFSSSTITLLPRKLGETFGEVAARRRAERDRLGKEESLDKLGELGDEPAKTDDRIEDTVDATPFGSQPGHDEASDPAKFLSQLKLPYQDFYKDFSDSVSGQGQMTSFEEQKSFHKIFNYLKNEHGSIGITDTVKKITGFSDLTVNQLLGNEESRLVSEKSSAIKKRFDDKLKHNREIMESLLPTLEYINNEINDSEQLSEFVRSEVLERFLQADKSELLKKHSLSEISKKSKEDASKPLVDKETLPILLRFCLNSMTNDFNSFDEAMLIINYIKRHQSIELYEFGLNIDVYNSLLEQIWSKTENLQLISAVVDELKVNAIQPDMMTYKILAQVYLTCMRIKDEVKAEPYLLWGESGDIYKVKDFIGGIKTIH